MSVSPRLDGREEWRGGREGRWILFLCLFAAAFLVLSPASGKVDPVTGRIRLLHIGDAFNSAGFAATFFFQDPRIVMTPVPSEVAILGQEETQRYYRLYLPRTEKRVREGFDVVCIAGAFQYQLGKFPLWTKSAVLEEGVGFVMADDPASFGGTGWRGVDNNWCDTPIGAILPVRCAVNGKSWSDVTFKIEVVLPDHPLVKGIPWDEAVFIAHNRVYYKQGSVVVAKTRSNPPGLPVIAYMDVGEGRSVALDHDWGGRADYAFSPGGGVWDWAPHFFSSLIYHAAQTPIPDPFMDKTVKEKLSTFLSQRRLVLSIIDFADTFGANTIPLVRELGEIDGSEADAEKLYIEMDLEKASENMDVLLSRMDKMIGRAMEVKDRALLWIYIIEWSAVTGVSIVCGYVVYALMVRRRLYRQVASTRFHR